MKSRLWFLRRSFALGLALIITGAGAVLSAQNAPPASVPQANTPLLSPQQIDNLVAPIALYPDPLLTQVMVASTYPLEIVEAQQWLQKNSSLKGEALMKAAQQQPWDASVQALVAFPDVLARLNQDVGWTNALGNAFLAQQGGRDEGGPADAHFGDGEWQVVFHAAADRHNPDGKWTTHDHNST